MKKSIIVIFSLLLITGCSGQNNAGVLNEKTVPGNANTFNDGEVMSRIIELKNGAKPQVKPTGSTGASTPATPVPPAPPASPVPSMKLENLSDTYKFAVLKTNYGDIKLAFYPQDAKITVNNFLNLAKDGFYNGTKFHRVIKDFMIQGGDPLSKDDAAVDSWGTGGPGYKFADEINSHKLVKGSLAMANSGANTNGSQFFIVTKESTPWLDGKHTCFGEVVEGLDVVMKIDGVATGVNDRPVDNVVLQSVELLEK